MKRELGDGTVVQDGLHYRERTNGFDANFIPYPVGAYVKKVYTLDDDKNPTGQAILCDLFVPSLAIDLFGVPWTLEKCSVDNYIEYRPQGLKGNIVATGLTIPTLDDNRLEPDKVDCDFVMVVFLDGDVRNPMIIKTIPHPQSGLQGNSPVPRQGKEGGDDYYRMRMNGTNVGIDKDGNILIESTETFDKLLNANKKIEIKFKGLGQPQELNITIDNALNAQKIDFEIKDLLGKSQKFTMDGADQSITMQNDTTADSNKIKMNSDGIEINTGTLGDLKLVVGGNVDMQVIGDTTMQHTGNLELTVAGDLTANVTGDLSVTAVGKTTLMSNDDITIQSVANVMIKGAVNVNVEATSNATVKATVKAKVDAPMIDLGAAATDFIIKGTTFQTGYNSHTHATAVGPSGPPIPLSTPADLSTVVKTQ